MMILYMHAGSGNHGCEAIVNSLLHMLKESEKAEQAQHGSPYQKPVVLTNSAEEDEKYSLKGLCELRQERHFSEHRFLHVLYYIWRRMRHDPESFLRFRYKEVLTNRDSLAVSIGGDNYCYDSMINDLILANRVFHHAGMQTVLLGCSIEPELLSRQDVKEDMNSYRAVIARESMTYEALRSIMQEDRLFLFPDPAFTLKAEPYPLPAGFAIDNTIGINVSPMIQDKENKPGITMENYKALLQHIIDTGNMQIALIPHVVWERNDDRKPLQELYDAFRDTGRVVMIADASCEELKGCIASCRMFIGARTHATIAAYSSLVPTLVVGYSVKAKGIAKDLFGTYDNYVIPVQLLEQKEDLIRAYTWLLNNEDQMRLTLSDIMPGYQARALETGKEVEKLWEESNMQQKI